MRCLICQKTFYFKRTLKNLFDLQEDLICDKCKKEISINIKVQIIPLDNRKLINFYFFDQKMFYDLDLFSNEMYQLIDTINKIKENNIILLYDFFKLTENVLKEMEKVATLTDEIVYVISYFA